MSEPITREIECRAIVRFKDGKWQLRLQGAEWVLWRFHGWLRCTGGPTHNCSLDDTQITSMSFEAGGEPQCLEAITKRAEKAEARVKELESACAVLKEENEARFKQQCHADERLQSLRADAEIGRLVRGLPRNSRLTHTLNGFWTFARNGDLYNTGTHETILGILREVVL